jgi:hypothetical protein
MTIQHIGEFSPTETKNPQICFCPFLKRLENFSPKTLFSRRNFALSVMSAQPIWAPNSVGAQDPTRNEVLTDQQPVRSESGPDLVNIHGQFVTCRLDELHPHPSYVRHHLTVPASQLSALAERGDLAFREPVVITRDRTIIDGYARVELARLQRRITLPCIEYELNEADALRWFLQMHLRSNGLVAFSRIILALELEYWFRERARSNQRVGGQSKGSSKLTEAEKLDVRREIAAAANSSVGNVGKVKQLMTNAPPEVVEALRSREISIHRAWTWSKDAPEKQREKLRVYQSERGIKRTIRNLISCHRSKSALSTLDLGSLVGQLSKLKPSELALVGVAVIKIPGRIVFLTEDLFRDLSAKEEPPPCATNSR